MFFYAGCLRNQQMLNSPKRIGSQFWPQYQVNMVSLVESGTLFSFLSMTSFNLCLTYTQKAIPKVKIPTGVYLSRVVRFMLFVKNKISSCSNKDLLFLFHDVC